MLQPQGVRCENPDGCDWIAPPRQNVEDDVGGVYALGESFGAGGLDRRQPFGEHRRENVHHLPIAIVGAGELAPHALNRRREHPVLEGCTVA